MIRFQLERHCRIKQKLRDNMECMKKKEKIHAKKSAKNSSVIEYAVFMTLL